MKATSGLTIQNSVRWRRVLLFCRPEGRAKAVDLAQAGRSGLQVELAGWVRAMGSRSNPPGRGSDLLTCYVVKIGVSTRVKPLSLKYLPDGVDHRVPDLGYAPLPVRRRWRWRWRIRKSTPCGLGVMG